MQSMTEETRNFLLFRLAICALVAGTIVWPDLLLRIWALLFLALSLPFLAVMFVVGLWS
jgi:hypothetical protein